MPPEQMSDDDIKWVHEQRLADDRAKWAWRTARVFGGYLAAFFTAAYALWEFVIKHVRFAP